MNANLHSHFDYVKLNDVMQPPQQERSRRTLNLLLAAAEGLLEEKGLEGTTVPAIAERAGVSVGVVYRRFPDKDALLRAIYERFFIEMSERNRTTIEAVAQRDIPLPRLARGLILGIVQGYRARRGMIRALTHYARTHRDPKFRRKAMKMNHQAMDYVAELLLRQREQIGHPDPETAIEFGLLAVTAVLRQVVIEEEPLLSIAPKNLDEELVRMFFTYLGISDRPADRSGRERPPRRSRNRALPAR